MVATRSKKTRKVTGKSKDTVARQATKAKPISPSQEGLQLTWRLKGELKNSQLKYLLVAELLCEVRDKKLYEALKHPDMESYAEERLNLGRTSMYRYLQVYDWVREFHKAWLDPKPKGFIPELTDVADLIWIERELQKKDLDPDLRSALDALRKKALNGHLRKSDVDKLRRKGQPKVQGLKTLLTKIRFIRMRGSQLASMPPEAVGLLDRLIEVIASSLALDRAGIEKK